MAGGHGVARGSAWSREQIADFQGRQLRALVRHAYDRVPYYRRTFDEAGLKPEDICGIEDLGRIPFTSRADLQRLRAEEIVARGFDPRRLYEHRTSGSSGEPLCTRRTWFEERLLEANRLRVLRTYGFRLTDKRAGATLVRGIGPPLYARLGLLRHEQVNCLWPAERILARLREIRPDVLQGYPGTLSWVANFLTEADRSAIRPRFITTGAEVLTIDMRARIREAFRAPVFDSYGSHEFSLIGWECAVSGRFHVSDATVIVEVLKDGRAAQPGEDGELVGTALHSWAMPFLRYRLGDLVTRGESMCPCGAPNSVLSRVQGRVVDRFPMPDGRSIHPYTLVAPLAADVPWLLRYQIVQEQLDQICVRLVPREKAALPPNAAADMASRLTAELPGGVRVSVHVVDEIPPDASGKFRPYYSLAPKA